MHVLLQPWEAAGDELLVDEDEVRPSYQATNVLTFGGDTLPRSGQNTRQNTLPRSGQTSLLREPLMVRIRRSQPWSAGRDLNIGGAAVVCAAQEEHRYAHRVDYDDLFHEPDPSFWRCIGIAAQEHMDAVDNWPALQGFLLLAIGGVLVAVGPLFISPQIDGENYGLIFSWGVIVINVRTHARRRGGRSRKTNMRAGTGDPPPGRGPVHGGEPGDGPGHPHFHLLAGAFAAVRTARPARARLVLDRVRAGACPLHERVRTRNTSGPDRPVPRGRSVSQMLECMLTVGSTVAVSGTIYKFLG